LLESAYLAAKAAAEAEPGDWYTLATFGQTLMNKRDYVGAAAQFDRAIALDRSNTLLLTRSTLPLIFLGRGQEAEARLRIAIRLNPYHNWLPDQLLGQSLFILERYQEAIDNLLIAGKKNPRFIGNLWWKAAAYGQLGMQAEAQDAVASILKLAPGAAISKSFIQIKDEAVMARFTDGLRAAGLPE
jgi:adenylate cyclase